MAGRECESLLSPRSPCWRLGVSKLFPLKPQEGWTEGNIFAQIVEFLGKWHFSRCAPRLPESETPHQSMDSSVAATVAMKPNPPGTHPSHSHQYTGARRVCVHPKIQIRILEQRCSKEPQAGINPDVHQQEDRGKNVAHPYSAIRVKNFGCRGRIQHAEQKTRAECGRRDPIHRELERRCLEDGGVPARRACGRLLEVGRAQHLLLNGGYLHLCTHVQTCLSSVCKMHSFTRHTRPS